MEAIENVVTRRYFEEFFSAPGNLQVADEIFAPNVVFRNPISSQAITGIDAYKRFAWGWYVGFPDRRVTINDLIVQGNRSAAYFTIQATHQGVFAGVPATGREVQVNAMNLFRFTGERISDVQAFFNPIDLLGPIGAPIPGVSPPAPVPTPPTSPTHALPPLLPGSRIPAINYDSGRRFEALLEHEHLLGGRIFDCAERIVESLKSSAAHTPVPANLHSAIGILVYLTQNFADQGHLQSEETILPLAVARGLDPRQAQWMFLHHKQVRAYWQAMAIAWERILTGDVEDYPYAIQDFFRTAEAFIIMFRHHAIRENHVLFPQMGAYFSEADDALITKIMSQVGPPDKTPYINLVVEMERLLGIVHSPAQGR